MKIKRAISSQFKRPIILEYYKSFEYNYPLLIHHLVIWQLRAFLDINLLFIFINIQKSIKKIDININI